MREPIARSCDGAPGHFGVTLSLFIGNVLCCLADDLHETCKRECQLQITIKLVAPTTLNEAIA